MKDRLLNQFLMNGLIEDAGKIAVLSVAEPEKAVETARKLLKNGVNAMEIAYRNLDNLQGSDECIKAVRKNVPEMLVGAATVTCPELAKRAKSAGAQFVLTAGFNPKTVKFCVRNKIPVFPGVATPGEIEQAIGFGLSVLKIFPIEVLGGIKYLKALSGPYPNIKFIVSGGINAENCAVYAETKNVAAVSGSYLC